MSSRRSRTRATPPSHVEAGASSCPHVSSLRVAHTLENLVTLQRAADQAHAAVLALRDQYGRPSAVEWTDEQTLAYEQAWKTWREQASAVQAAVTEHAQDEGKARFEIEAAVRKAARHSGPAEG